MELNIPEILSENILVFSISGFMLFGITILSLLSYDNKNINNTNNNPRKRKKRYSKKKHRFVDRPSLLDSGMSMILPWHSVSTKTIFYGWYNLCWLLLLSFILTQFHDNYVQHGRIINNWRFFTSLYTTLHELIITILPIYAISFSAFFLQKLMIYNICGKKYTRYILHFIQHCIQTIMIFGVGAFVYFFCEHWPFSQKMALTMQSLCLYMKMHSYLLSNFELYQMKQESLKRTKLSKDGINNDESPSSSIELTTMSDVNKLTDKQVIDELRRRGLRDLNLLPDSAQFFCYFATMGDDENQDGNGYNTPSNEYQPKCFQSKKLSPMRYQSTQSKINRMIRQTSGDNNNDINDKEQEIRVNLRNHQNIKESILNLQKLEEKQDRMNYFRMVLKDAIFLENYRSNIYPKNVTLWNWFEFTWMPTVVYEPLYPRTSGIRLFYLLEKSISVIIIITVMYTTFEKFMYPTLTNTKLSPIDSIIKLLIPAVILEVLGFFCVFDCILNFFAEFTCFADREFYQDWWNSTSFEEFARKWNQPVHQFLLRHVYYESMNNYKFDKSLATVGTFIFSIVLHEVVLSACTHRFRPWLAVMSLFQIPLMPAMKSSLFKDKPLGNLVFWCGLTLGIPMVAVLYARDYCSDPQFCEQISFMFRGTE